MDVGAASFILTVGLIIWLIMILSFWQVFTKAGYAGWKCIVPFYNHYILSKIGRQPLWVFISLFIPIANLIGSLLIALGVAKAFGKSELFGVVLWVFTFFGYMYLGWGQSEYVVSDESNNS